MPLPSLLRMDRSISARLLIPVIFVTLVLTTLLGVGAYGLVKPSIYEAWDSKINSSIDFLLVTAREYAFNYDYRALQNLCDHITVEQDVKYAAFFDKDGKTVASSGKDSVIIKSLIMVNKEMKDQDGKPLGSMKVGYTHDRLEKLLEGAIGLFAVLVILINVIVAVTLITGVRWAVVGPIKKTRELAQKITKGNLKARINLDRRDEIGEMSQALDAMADALQERANLADQIAEGNLSKTPQLLSNEDTLGFALEKMTTNLKTIIDQVKDAATLVNQGAIEIASASTALSSGASTQLASIEEVSNSIIQIASDTRNNADQASKAENLAQKTCAVANNGHVQMEAMLNAMQDIQGSSTEIEKIIKIIDDIAFQTHLLALNAAVEAARAGRFGKGFGVVAEEVKNLAARSSKAVQDTSSRIKHSLEKVSTGTQVASQTMDVLSQIVMGVMEVSEVISNIAVSSKSQAAAINSITAGLSQINSVTQQNTSYAEEAASSSNFLKSKAEELHHLLNWLQNA